MTLLTGVYAGTPLNTSEVLQADLDIANKFRSNPLRWNGQFSPQLIQVLLGKYAVPGAALFDPFLGSGTVLLEAGRAGLSACGTEINPAAVALAQTYKFINVQPEQRHSHLKAVSALLQREFLQALPLFQALDQNPAGYEPGTIKSRLVELRLGIEDRLQCQLLESLIVLLDFYQPDLSADKVFAAWNRLKRLVVELPSSQRPIEAFHADARETPLPGASVDLVVTSPPYINVFNYHQQYRASAEALSWDLLRVAKSEIGSNRKHRGNRFLTVVQFCLDMAQTFMELARVCRPDGRLIFVVGRESTVRGTPFFNGEIVAEVASRTVGFGLVLRQERVFQNRFGQSIFEDVLHFSPPVAAPGELFLERARKVAQEVLEATCPTAPDEAKEGIESALADIDRVRPSPIFNLSKACKPSREVPNARLAYPSRG